MTEAEDWRRYREGGDESARSRLVERHMRLVHHFAGRLSARSGGRLSREELVSAGSVGLLEAVEGYDPDRGYRFSTFAGTRIRGAMLDELRSRDPVTRGGRRHEREMKAAEERLTVRLDRRPHHGEVAAELDVEPGTLWRWKSAASRGAVVSMDEPAGRGVEGGARLSELLEDPSSEDVEERLIREGDVRRLRRELERLDGRERLVLSLYDLEELKLKEIAEVLGVSESRVSQIRTRALKRLRTRMTAAVAA